MGNGKNRDLFVDNFVNNGVGELPGNHAPALGIISWPPQRALFDQTETSFKFTLEIVGDPDPVGEIPRICCVIIL